MRTPLIIDIKGNSLDDGPGIRSVVFFKGCPLSCAWCHNPESKRPFGEISFDRQKCIACDSCIEKCPSGALSRDNPFFVDRNRCTRCFACVGECPAVALSRIGSEMSREEIIEKVLKDKPFLDSSGGGVTFSGGEPTLHMDFLSGLAMALKNSGVHTLIETCGYFNFDEFREAVLPHINMIYMDIKLFNPKQHKRYCGVDNAVILENFIRLHELSIQGGFEIVPRTPLIPGITDTEENLAAIARFLKSYQVKEIRLLPNNPTWHEKCFSLGISDRFMEDSPLREWLPPAVVEACKCIFKCLNNSYETRS
ncbi:MAG: glycyl-radical enzyme activating protein [Spirochaetes bacterium]|nr:MAG: glycyl-radical enzyme activating protein [Spirochaetota bacterium]